MKMDAWKLIEWHIHELLKSGHKRITTKQSFRNPWTISVSRLMHYSVFLEVYRCFRDRRPKYGFCVTKVRYKGKSQHEYKTIEIKFTDIGVAKELLRKFVSDLKEDDYASLFVKAFSGGLRAEIVASEEKPIILFFKTQTHTVSFSAHYELKNKYGIMM